MALHQYKFQTSFPNICGNFLYCEDSYLIKHACPFYSFKLRHLRQISERGHSFVILLSLCITTFRLFELVHVCTAYTAKLFGFVIETLAQFHSCVLEISPFFAKFYIFCVPIRSKSDSFENYMDSSRIFCLLKRCML